MFLIETFNMPQSQRHSSLPRNSSGPRRLLLAGLLIASAMTVGCQNDADGNATPVQPATGDQDPYSQTEEPKDKAITFKDEVEWNQESPVDVTDLVFRDKTGSEIRIADFAGKKNVVLVFTKGFIGMLCPFCQTQTSRLIGNYEKFQERETEVLVVYPGERDRLADFIDAALNIEKKQVDLVPFPIVLDEAYQAAEFFEIRKESRVHPSTFIIDKSGAIQLAYVGEDMTADRPSVGAILKSIDMINRK